MDLELKTALDTLQGETKTIFTELKAKYDALTAEHAKMQTQVDAIDLSGRERGFGGGSKSLVDMLTENESVSRLLRDRKGSAILNFKGTDADIFERKSTITAGAAGFQTTGVLQIDRIPGITPEARQVLRVRDVLTANPTNLGYVDFVKVNTPMTIASMQVEASTKAENAVTFVAASEKIRTIATWIPASRQVLDDLSELAVFIDGSLRYYVNLAEDIQLLSGDGTGENLHGLIPQGATFDTSALSSSHGWNYIDQIGLALVQQAVAKELEPTFVIVNPKDWGTMRLLKDGFGRYILGDPQAVITPSLFGKTVVPTTSIANGTYLVGSGDPVGAEIRDRMEMQVEISTEHSDYFVKNLVAVRAEKRLALCVKRPRAFLTGSFTSSPA